MAYNVTLRERNIAGEVNIFDSSQVRWVRGGVTLDASQVPEIDGRKRLSIGEFLGKITATGKYGPVKRSALAANAEAPVAATLTTSLTGSNNDLVFTSKIPGFAGNQIAIQFVDPGAQGSLSISVVGKTIVVTLANDENPSITTTANDIIEAIEEDADASALVDVALAEGNDGTGVVTAMALTALEGGQDKDLNQIELDPTVLGGASRFQAGDVILIDGDEYTIAAVDYETHVVTLTTSLSGDYSEGDVVKAKNGLGDAVLMLGETVDFALDGGNVGAYGDQVATAFDWARVLSARLPRTPDATVKQQLPNITFV